jgi:hypothetical protein
MTLRELIEDALKQAMESPETLNQEVVYQYKPGQFIPVTYLKDMLAIPVENGLYEHGENGMRVYKNSVSLMEIG